MCPCGFLQKDRTVYIMAGAIKNVKDYKFAIVFYSAQSKRTEVELFRNEDSRAERAKNLLVHGKTITLATVNRT